MLSQAQPDLQLHGWTLSNAGDTIRSTDQLRSLVLLIMLRRAKHHATQTCSLIHGSRSRDLHAEPRETGPSGRLRLKTARKGRPTSSSEPFFLPVCLKVGAVAPSQSG